MSYSRGGGRRIELVDSKSEDDDDEALFEEGYLGMEHDREELYLQVRNQRSEPPKEKHRKERRFEQMFSETFGTPLEERGSKHDRKNGRRDKLEGVERHDLELTEPIETVPQVEPQQALVPEVQVDDDDDDGHQYNAGRPSLSIPLIAYELVQGLGKFGVTAFLCGGSAITMQGGPRPAGDLDFRVTMDDLGCTTFAEPIGLAALEFLNQCVLPKSRQDHKGCGEVNAFAPVGGGALTIGTGCWFGVEVSVSIVYFRPSPLVDAQTLDGGLPPIRLLSLEDLRADKLKSLITRRKSGKESLAKIAKDLFDFLTVCVLLDREHGELGIEGHLDQASGGKLGEYSFVNHDGRPWHDAPPEKVAQLMKARTVLTAQAHTEEGDRMDAFESLVSTLCEEHDTDEQMLGLISEAQGLLDQLTAIHVPKSLAQPLHGWFEEWNSGPEFAPPQPFQRLKPPEKDSELPTDEELLTPAGEILAFADRKRHIAAFTRLKLTDSEQTIVLVLLGCGGERALPFRPTGKLTMFRFGLGANQLDRAMKALAMKGLATWTDLGVSLTDKSWQEFG